VPTDGGVDLYSRWEANRPYPGFTRCFANRVELEKASVLVLVTSPRSLSASTRRLDSGRTPAPRLSLRRRFYRGSFAAPKSRYGQRTIPLTPGLARSLWELRKNAGVAEGELVFPSETGTVIDSSNLASRVLKPAARKAGVGWARDLCPPLARRPSRGELPRRCHRAGPEGNRWATRRAENDRDTKAADSARTA
jgi:hypothetical protein